MPPHRAIERLGELGLSVRDVASALHIDPRTVERWVSGDTHPQREARQGLVALLRLDGYLRATFTDAEAAGEWLRAPSRYLGGLSPVEAVRVGRLDRVEVALEALDSGIFV